MQMGRPIDLLRLGSAERPGELRRLGNKEVKQFDHHHWIAAAQVGLKLDEGRTVNAGRRGGRLRQHHRLRAWPQGGDPFKGGHQVVNHGKGDYGQGEHTTNTVEGFFSIFKRGMKGVYQHCSEEHLHRYLAEFDFRYNQRSALGISDTMRTDEALRGIAGKRLTYRRSSEAAYA